ncbi:M20/M25/M40 family metallo-hydrolase [Kordiimonas marina]|uniref:M20/M25/M40 family metallo-hydrolase n=1 Tax=Kordiimonas marina TaxID=2872312 RepID=UPI001FF10DD0|nr:M20/M25/M40 family metallo-hydrolase [Kordiimonas marina]MCJ9429947.1 M20/M25/M40 family metallo-hydrolase [Kordiimonas marina]
MKRLLKLLVLGVVALVVFMVARTVMVLPAGTAKSIHTESHDPAEVREMAEHLAAAIRFKTISYSYDVAPDDAAFTGFHEFLKKTYPYAFQAMELTPVGKYSMMLRWPGTDGGKQKPIAFLAHQDVVPVPEEGLKEWKHPPFDGVIDDKGVIWGRGAMDDKGILISLMEAANRLARTGFKPSRDIYFLFGHDEELGGRDGAAQMAAMLKAKGVRFSWIVDEGSAIAQGIIPGVKSPVALISLGEKGSVTLKFSATDEGGHSSAPKAYTAASLAARAGYLVMDHPYPLVLDEHLESFLKAVAPEMDFGRRVAIANMWLTRPLMARMLAKSPTVAAFMHTTTAFTMMKGGTKFNVLPQYAEAVVNYRVHPRDTVAGVIARAKKIVGDDRVKITSMGGAEATSMSDPKAEGYKEIAASVRAIFGDIPIAPTLTVQGTDARHYDDVTDNSYRFMPMVFHPEDLHHIHGNNEALGSEALANQVDFFVTLMEKGGG